MNGANIPNFMRLAMLAYAETVMASRSPDVIIGDEANPYVKRWWLGPHGLEASAYLHLFLRSDYDGALHDHRYKNVSIILNGECYEHFHKLPLIVKGEGFETYAFRRREGDIIERPAKVPHRIELIDNKPMTTIFYTGQHERDWGFHTVDGWEHWKTFTEKYANDRPGGNYGKTGI